MSTSPIRRLREVNDKLRARLDRLPGGYHSSTVVAPTEFTDLLAELQRATHCLRNLPATALDAEMSGEISEYRSHVQELRKIVPSLQGRLLIEKARLETVRTHVVKAAAWAEGSKKTL
jgi:hypothetical protein